MAQLTSGAHRVVAIVVAVWLVPVPAYADGVPVPQSATALLVAVGFVAMAWWLRPRD